MLCSEWVPSEWESDKNITIIHTTPVHQLSSGEDKSWNKSSIEMSLTSNCCFWPKSIIHNNNSSSVSSESGEESSTVYKPKQSKTILKIYVSGFLWLVYGAYSSPDSDETLEESLLWIMDFGQKQQFEVKDILMMDLFELLSSPDVNWWTGVVWIIVMFLSDSHSDGTHSLPLLRHWCNATFLQIWWRNKLILISDDLRMSKYVANVRFWVN